MVRKIFIIYPVLGINGISLFGLSHNPSVEAKRKNDLETVATFTIEL